MALGRPPVRPPALRPGDRIAIVAPASPPNPSQVERGVAELETWGFDVVLDDRVFAVEQGYLAGAAARRAAHLQEAFADDAIAGIVCVRGGYGSVQTLPHLDLARIAATPKVFVGYSDITTLLNAFTLQAGFVTFHGPMVEGRFGEPGRYDRGTFAKAIASAEPMGALVPAGLDVMQAGEATGPLLGGTLTMLAASLGTPWAFDPPAGHILFVDEVNERPYRIDRLFTQLRQAGVLGRAAGLVVNELPGCDEPDGSLRGMDALRAMLADFPGPIVTGFPSGHTPGAAVTLPIGVTATLMASGRPALVIEESAVTA